MRIVDATGTAVATYTYDAWGNPISNTTATPSTLESLNPLRYRSYVYDAETELYYLQSRYYNPEIGRFISADIFISTGQGFVGNNMFAYCGNNPIIRSDTNGERYCASTTVSNECDDDRKMACAFQNDVIWEIFSNYYGAAIPYRPYMEKIPNCLGYVLRKYRWYLLDAVGSVSLTEAYRLTIELLASEGFNVRPISGWYSPITSDEYRIALRVGKEDYHYMVQHSDGTWSHKPAACVSRLINGSNPSAVSWDLPEYDVDYYNRYGVIIETGVIPNYYNSTTLYFAIS